MMEIVLKYKTEKCGKGLCENKENCFYYHSKADKRRCPLESEYFCYLPSLFIEGIFAISQKNNYCKNIYEFNFHPLNYKSKFCSRYKILGDCTLGLYCPHFHSEENLDELNKIRDIIKPSLQIENLFSFTPCLLSQLKLSPSKDYKITPYRPHIVFLEESQEEAYVQGSHVDFQEDTEHEFKNWSFYKNFDWLMGSIQEYICAFVNTCGGTIYIGINDDGEIVGTVLSRHLMDKIRLSLDQIRMSFRPMLNLPSQLQVKFVRCSSCKRTVVAETYVIEIIIQQGCPYESYTTYDGRLFVRLTASNRELTGPALVQYVKDKALYFKY